MKPSDHTLLVTGANGFVGGHLLQRALKRGYNIRATIRSQRAQELILTQFSEYSSQLSFALIPGITSPEFYKTAFDGANITGVIHLASPVHLHPEDNIRDMLEPAIKGAVSIVQAVSRYAPTVQRIVNTSSFAAMLDVSQGFRPGYTYDEDDWNPMTYEEAAKAGPLGAYCASKALAEKGMWEYMKSEPKPTFDLVSVNPAVIYGPHVYPIRDLNALNPSCAAIWALVDAPSIPAPDYAAYVDVRDVADALLLAFETPKARGERLLVAQHFDWQSAADAARSALPETARTRIPKDVPMNDERWRNEVYAVDGSKSPKILGFQYLTLQDTIGDSLKQYLEVEEKTRQAKD